MCYREKSYLGGVQLMVLCVITAHVHVHGYLFQIPYPLLAHFSAPLYSFHLEKFVESLCQ